MSEIVFVPNCKVDYHNHLGVIEHSFASALAEAKERRSFITTQVALLMEPEIKEYDIVRIINRATDDCAIRNNHDGTWSCDRTDRELRDAHNFYRLWRNGEFDQSL